MKFEVTNRMRNQPYMVQVLSSVVGDVEDLSLFLLQAMKQCGWN